MGISILVRRHLYIEMAPRAPEEATISVELTNTSTPSSTWQSPRRPHHLNIASRLKNHTVPTNYGVMNVCVCACVCVCVCVCVWGGGGGGGGGGGDHIRIYVYPYIGADDNNSLRLQQSSPFAADI